MWVKSLWERVIWFGTMKYVKNKNKPGQERRQIRELSYNYSFNCICVWKIMTSSYFLLWVIVKNIWKNYLIPLLQDPHQNKFLTKTHQVTVGRHLDLAISHTPIQLWWWVWNITHPTEWNERTNSNKEDTGSQSVFPARHLLHILK